MTPKNERLSNIDTSFFIKEVQNYYGGYRVLPDKNDAI